MEEKNLQDQSEGSDIKTESRNGKNGVPLWVWVIIVILVLVCVYFLSLINSKKFQISEKNGYLIVRKGLFLPYGFSEYIPQDMVKREAYAPLKIPEGEVVVPAEVDRGELDIALFRIISGWIEKYLKSENEENLKIASGYIERLMKLNVSPDDFEKYSRLKGELVFRQARFSFNMGLDLIRKSREKISSIKNLSPEFLRESEELLDRIDRIEKAQSQDYLLLKRQDVEKIREEVKKECINSCLRETIERSAQNQISPPVPDVQEQQTQKATEQKDEK
ncbi:MAG: hypothetical protein N3B13_00350 [Deltaproteobacteria bacterium]|nr:hypothetical protein [Deltaproteobacteria bacterium]